MILGITYQTWNQQYKFILSSFLCHTNCGQDRQGRFKEKLKNVQM